MVKLSIVLEEWGKVLFCIGKVWHGKGEVKWRKGVVKQCTGKV